MLIPYYWSHYRFRTIDPNIDFTLSIFNIDSILSTPMSISYYWFNTIDPQYWSHTIDLKFDSILSISISIQYSQSWHRFNQDSWGKNIHTNIGHPAPPSMISIVGEKCSTISIPRNDQHSISLPSIELNSPRISTSINSANLNWKRSPWVCYVHLLGVTVWYSPQSTLPCILELVNSTPCLFTHQHIPVAPWHCIDW